MNRRESISVVMGCLIATPFTAEAQQAPRIYRLGILRSTAPSPEIDSGILMALRALGYDEGRNLSVQYRHAKGRLDELPQLARELIQLRVEVICTIGLAATRAAKEATTSIPIVMFLDGDPVASGLVPSLARPGGNLTGILLSADGTLTAKRLELVKEAVPQAARIAFLALEDQGSQRQVQEARKTASSLGVDLVVAVVRDGDYELAFAAMMSERPHALSVAASTFFVRDRLRIIELAAKHWLPTIYESPGHARSGGLMAYATSTSALELRRATYIDRIFKGAKPGDLPIEQPTRFELVINLKTAKVLGITIPQSLLLRADEVIA